jgi:hypothetical protein
MADTRTTRAAAPEALGAAQALDTLVNQFADPLSFFRELVQNSIDAGSPEVGIRFEYQDSPDGGDGAMVIHVDDWGEGMSRDIIDSKLTRLFSSTKEDDFTKIGRFGIGFVSVFALQPDAVCLDTSRGGENWRVLFRKDRTFVRIARDEPVDGTKIQVIKSLPRAEYEKLRARAGDVVAYWCKHLASPVRIDGQPVNQPLDVDVPCRVRHEEPGTEVVVGYTTDNSSFAGFYNRGLTLLETKDTPFPAIALKISSRYLEHTLTRDNVIRDANFDKAMAIVRRMVHGTLPARLLDMLEAELQRDPSGASAEPLFELLARNFPLLPALPPGAGERRLFRSVDDRPLTVAECRRAARRGALYRCLPHSPVGRTLAKDGKVVVAPRSDSAVRALAVLVGGSPPWADQLFCQPQPLAPGQTPPGGEALCSALAALLRDQGMALAGFSYPGSGIGGRIAVTQKSLGELTTLDEARRYGSSVLSRRRTFVLNAQHPAVRQMSALAESEPELAAYLAAKLFFLGAELTTQVDSRLAQAALEARCRRRTA